MSDILPNTACFKQLAKLIALICLNGTWNVTLRILAFETFFRLETTFFHDTEELLHCHQKEGKMKGVPPPFQFPGQAHHYTNPAFVAFDR